jgi:16S rRNA (cytidine1402-2'-O)-methyltransferase
LKQGQQISLVTDGGTPGISDPGRELVREARQARIAVVPIPGPSALTCALSVSGLPGDSFIFLGFLPRRKSRRKRILQEMKEQKRTVIFYEAPHRIRDLLEKSKPFWVIGSDPARIDQDSRNHIGQSAVARQLAIRNPKGIYALLSPAEKSNSKFGFGTTIFSGMVLNFGTCFKRG